ALYDAQARTLGVPLYELLGGSVRQGVPVGIALSIAGDVPAMIGAAEEAVAQGYRHLRIKIGLDARKDVEGLTALRKHFGDDVVLRADANGAMQYGDALRLLHRLEPLDLDIVEQPLPSWDLDGMAHLARAVNIPLSADESLTDAQSLLEIARAGAARVIQTKSAKNGGIHGIRKIWTVAQALGVDIFPGNHPSTGINVAAVAHLCAAWPGRLLVGDFQTGLVGMLAEDILQQTVRVADGQVTVPGGPGLGVALDEDKLRRYRADL
ncbi:MAG TPA: enolase C-terminal domain-like protein, partial [Ramlibacter sp.]|nr:enolase C-terminal domain-like protein [Ramlibacter sp.]